nr:HlyD family efflux transporter periplasmic adaptor subunit [Gloeothece citriformis]
MNGHNGNGHYSNGHHANGNGNGNGNGHKSGMITTAPKPEIKDSQSFNFLPSFTAPEKGVVLRQSPTWSRGVVWTIVGVTVAAIIWAAVAPIEQVVQATGQLKPQGKVKEVQAPVNGVVKEVLVKDGEKVEKGEVLVIFDTEASKAELASYKQIRQALQQENQFYQMLMEENLDPSQVETAIIQLKLPKEVATLARNRIALMAENQLFRIQVGESVANAALDREQFARLEAARRELDSRALAAKLEINQLQKQLSQTQVQLADAESQLVADRLVLQEIKTRNEDLLQQSQASLKIEQQILSEISPLAEEGALARYQINKQQQSVNDRIADIVEKQGNGEIEYKKQLQQIETRIAEIQRFQEEEQRLQAAISQARERYMNTQAVTEKDVRDRIAENKKRMAEVDSQLTKIIVDNRNRIAEYDSQISRANQTLRYQELRAPVGGTVFDLQAFPGFVPQPSQAEALLKIVPDDYLIAEVDVINKDIGFVRNDMKADIRIDSFPFSEYGDIKGKVVSIGSDALPPDEIYKYYRFPTRIQLDDQFLKIQNREIPLQSGMSISANIKIRENRTVLSLFTEQFTRSVESLKKVD